MEMAILEDISENDFNMLQFCFVAKRNTNTAISLANDVIQYINKRDHLFIHAGLMPKWHLMVYQIVCSCIQP